MHEKKSMGFSISLHDAIAGLPSAQENAGKLWRRRWSAVTEVTGATQRWYAPRGVFASVIVLLWARVRVGGAVFPSRSSIEAALGAFPFWKVFAQWMLAMRLAV
jgi:hypothetical protein